MSLNVLERTREIGIMRSLGATNTKFIFTGNNGRIGYRWFKLVTSAAS